MRVSKSSFLDHVKWLRRAVQAAGGDFLVAGDTMQALVRRGTRSLVLHPRFLTRAGHEVLVTPQLHDATDAFLGWLPYASRPFPLGADPGAFRELARSLGLRAPELFAERPASGVAVVVTREAAPVRQVHGPFRSADEHSADLSRGERYERFVEGDLLRVWLWNGAPVCAERDTTPFVVGDGVSTMGDLIARRADEGKLLSARDREVLLARSAVVLRYHGHTLATVLPSGARHRVEVGYGVSPPLTPEDHQLLELGSDPGPAWLPSLRDAGRRLLGAMPEAVRSSMLFAMDVILDDQQQVWLLSMDGHPVVHPLVYPAMISDLVATQPIRDAPTRTPNPTAIANETGAPSDRS